MFLTTCWYQVWQIPLMCVLFCLVSPTTRRVSKSTPVLRTRDSWRGDLNPDHLEDSHSSPVGSQSLDAWSCAHDIRRCDSSPTLVS